MTFYVWAALYLLFGAFTSGLYFRGSNRLTNDEAPLVLIPDVLCPIIVVTWILASAFRLGQRLLGRRSS